MQCSCAKAQCGHGRCHRFLGYSSSPEPASAADRISAGSKPILFLLAALSTATFIQLICPHPYLSLVMALCQASSTRGGKRPLGARPSLHSVGLCVWESIRGHL